MTKKIDSILTKEIPPSVDHKIGIKLLEELISEAEKLRSLPILSEMEKTGWETLASEYLIKIYGSNSSNLSKIINSSVSISISSDEQYWSSKYKEIMEKRIFILRSFIQSLNVDIQVKSGLAPNQQQMIGEKIFIVHGHNNDALQTIARFIEKFQYEIIILHEKPNKGRTIIEKFEEECKGVGFAIILMTGDDKGGLKSDPIEKQFLRARQNVVLELGFFLGILGRNRVAVLYEDGVEIPSDFSGVLFIKIDPNSSWKLEIAREIKAVGFQIDMNKAL